MLGAAVADFQLRGIDAAIVEKVKTIARERGWSINDVMLHLLREALGLLPEGARAATPSPAANDAPAKMPGEVPPTLPGNFGQDENAALLEAIKAFESLPEDRSPFRMAGRDGR